MRLERLLHDGQLVVAVVDDEIPGKAHVPGFAAQQPGAERMERGDPHPAALLAEQGCHAGPHLLGGLVGKGDGEQTIWWRQPAVDDMRNPVCDDAGLARTRTGKDEKRTLCLKNCGLLFRVQLRCEIQPRYSTVTLLARFLGWSTSQPRLTAM